MLFTKEIEKITYQDILDFCNQQYRKNIHLDYKQNIDASLAKTITAMANTWGGLIVIGVEDEDSKPKLPLKGIEYKEHLREQINNIILGNIIPPLFPEVQICPDEKNEKALIVIRIPQSNHSPHAIRRNTRVYIRTDTSNEPEELATVDRVIWLVERRKKSTELKDSFYKIAEERFNKLCKRAGVTIKYNDAIFSISPLYPFEVLIDYRKLQKEIAEKIKVHRWGDTFPIYLINNAWFEPTQNGAYGFFAREDTCFVFYEELNHYGFFYHRENLCRSKKDETGRQKNHSSLRDILTRTDLFLTSIYNLYSELGYWGFLELKISLNKLDDVSFGDLPAPRGYYKIENITKSPIDEHIEFVKTISYQDLRENKEQLVIDLVKEISWAIGFAHIEEETIRQLMQENNRI